MRFTIRAYNQLASTNETLHALYAAGEADDGFVVSTKFQTAGKGLASNSWHSSAGQNLLVSVGLRFPHLLPEQQFEITKIVSLAVVQTVRFFVPEAALHIKWPNDIYLGNGKVAGMLISHIISGNHLEYTIIGLGLNVNEAQFPSWIPRPVSMSQLAHQYFEVEAVRDHWLQTLSSVVQEHQVNAAQVDAAYLAHLLNFGKRSEYLLNGDRISATIRGVDRYGMLLLETDDGQTRKCDLKELVFLFDED